MATGVEGGVWFSITGCDCVSDCEALAGVRIRIANGGSGACG